MRLVVASAATAVALAGALAPPALAESHPCRSGPAGYSLRASSLSCPDARSVQRTYFNDNSDCSSGCSIHTVNRTWHCSYRILGSSPPPPGTSGRRVHGRVLCTHIANRARFVRWEYHGQGD
jgi:hypothetical protein